MKTLLFIPLLLAALYVLLTRAATEGSSAELDEICVVGTAVESYEEAWPGHVNFIGWLDDEAIAYVDERSDVRCYNLSKHAETWNIRLGSKVNHFAIGRGQVFLLDEEGTVHVLEGSRGKTVRRLTQKDVCSVAGRKFLVLNNIAWVPRRNALLISSFSQEYGENSFLLDDRTFKLVGRVQSDGFLSDINSGQTGSHMVALSERIRIWSIDEKREIFQLSRDGSGGIDAPFISNAQFDEKKTLVYSIDNSWATGTVHVLDVKQDMELARFDSRNGHLEMDVDFKASRIALTGTGRNLLVVDFNGRVFAERPNAAAQRVSGVKFSPDRSRLAIGSWDNTLRVFEFRPPRARKGVQQDD